MSNRRFTLCLIATAILSGLVCVFALPGWAGKGVFLAADPTADPAYLLAQPCLHGNLIDAPLPESQPAMPAIEAFAFEPELVILTSGQNEGQLEICNCADSMEGGLSRRLSVVKAYRQRWPQTVLVDTGDLSAVQADATMDSFIRQGYGLLQYDAVAIGDQDLDAWASQPAAVLTQLPWLSGNLELAGVPTLAAAKTISRGGHEIQITARLTPQAAQFLEPKVREKATVHPLPITPALSEPAALRILLLHRDDYETITEELVAGFDLVILSQVSPDPFPPHQVGQAWVVAPPPTGKGLGVAALTLDGGRIRQFAWREQRIEAGQWPRDQTGWQLYQSYTAAAMREKQAAPQPAGLPYQSSFACGRCHPAEYRQWQTTGHAHAYATLRAVHRQEDPACLGCHTSGAGTKEGFVNPQRTAQLANVNCMDCHRLNPSEHLAQPQRPLAKVDETTCRGCHTEVASPTFQYGKAVPKVSHAH